MSLWKLIVVSDIIVGGNTVKFIVAPEVLKVFFDLRGEFFFQDSIVVKLLKNAEESTQVVSVLVLLSNFLDSIYHIQKVSNNIGEYHDTSKQNDSIENPLQSRIWSQITKTNSG